MQNVKLEQNAGVYAPIAFEGIVIAMIEVVIGSRISNRPLACPILKLLARLLHELYFTTKTATRTSPNKGFNEKNNGDARAL